MCTSSFSEVSPPFLSKCLVIEILFSHIADKSFVKSIFILDKHTPKDLSKSRVLTFNLFLYKIVPFRGCITPVISQLASHHMIVDNQVHVVTVLLRQISTPRYKRTLNVF